MVTLVRVYNHCEDLQEHYSVVGSHLHAGDSVVEESLYPVQCTMCSKSAEGHLVKKLSSRHRKKVIMFW